MMSINLSVTVEERLKYTELYFFPLHVFFESISNLCYFKFLSEKLKFKKKKIEKS